MKRRDFFRNSMAVAAAGMAAHPLLANAATPGEEEPIVEAVKSLGRAPDLKNLTAALTA